MPKDSRAGFPTYWTTFGQGPRDALMIHCSLAHSGSWGGVAGHLSGVLTMTAFDMPGHGCSDVWDDRGEIQGVTAEIAAAFCDGPRDVIGHSFGATVALRLAVARPDLVRSLVLIEPVFFAVAMQDAPEIWAAHAAEVAPFEAAWTDGDTRAAAEAFTGMWGDGTPWASVPARMQQALADQMHLIVAAGHALHNGPAGLLDDGGLAAITCPVLLLEGSASPPVIAAIQAGLIRRLPQAHRAVIAGAGHMVPITHADQVAREILRFL